MTSFAYDPAGQGKQAAVAYGESILLYFPAEQKEHEVWPTYEVNFPAGHGAQVEVLVEYCPA